MADSTAQPAPAAAAPPVAATEFRAMMSGFPTGVGVVTAFDDVGGPRGMTCSSVCSVALEPSTLLVSLRVGSPTLEAVLSSGAFAVNLLHGRAQVTAELFASGNPRRFELVRWEDGAGAAGPHLVQDVHTVADCQVSLTQPLGDHVVVFGEVHRITPRHALPPLLYGERQFRSWPETTPVGG